MGRKVRAPQGSVAANSRPLDIFDVEGGLEPQRLMPGNAPTTILQLSGQAGVKRGNLYAEQGQISPDIFPLGREKNGPFEVPIYWDVEAGWPRDAVKQFTEQDG